MRKQRKERAFFENGSKLLEKLIVSCNGKSIPIRSFSAQELQQATNDYNKCYGMHWYEGSLEGRMVFVKRFPKNESFAEFVINDLVISAQMSAHSNVLKPIGCCLETTCPILVYEFAANGFLADQIFVYHITQQQNQPMVWERKLKIARQIAHAISYLHAAFSRPVAHMYIDIKNILLDEHDVPKIVQLLFFRVNPRGRN